MARYFLTKTTVEPGALVEVAGTPALERYDALVQSLEGVTDPASIGVLAEPLLSHGNDVAPATVVWYSSYSGEPRRLSDLDPDRREAILSTMRARLVDITKGLSNPDFGPLVGAALSILDPDDIYVVDGQPILVGWGMVPPEANRSTAARNRHFAQSMARHLPLVEAPPLTPEEWRSRRVAAPPPEKEASTAPARPASRFFSRRRAGAATAAAAVAAAPAAPEAPGAGAPPAPPVQLKRRGGGWRWIPLVLLLLISVAALFWLLQPGTRLMPPVPAAPLIADNETLRIAREANAALEERAGLLEEAIGGARCTVEGELVLPNGRTAEGLLLPPVEEGADSAPVVGDALPDALLPPDPSRVEVPPEVRGGEAEVQDVVTLLDLIDKRTALVLVSGAAFGTGSGFFVGPDLLVTNDHVVEGVGPGGAVYVINEHLGEAREARILNRLGPLEVSGGDYALLQVPGANAPFFTLRDATETMRLQNVIAAGYPGVILDTDENFARLTSGDPGAIPSLAVTDGIVNVEQNLRGSTRVIIHTAEISGGNSGGPLVDGCGRVVGVNTFGRLDDRTNRFLNFALASTDLLQFLDGAGVQAARSAGPCVPRVRVATPPPPLEAEEDGSGSSEPEDAAEAAPDSE